MAISLRKYVDIRSGVAGQPALNTRQLILRVYTTNPLLPTGSIKDFALASSVGSYFGTMSEEYFRALFYFSFISKNFTSPSLISFARWADVDTAPIIYGVKVTTTLTQFQLITNGSFNLTLGATSHDILGLDFSAVASYADVATVLQTGIQAADITPLWTGATVVYNASTGAFDFTGGATGPAVVAVAAASSGVDIRANIGWTNLATYSDGYAAQTVTDVLTISSSQSDNFGSFVFTNTAGLTLDQIVEAAVWNYAQNVEFVYQVPVTPDNAVDYNAALVNIGGVGVTLNTTLAEFPEELPCAILASTDYTVSNSVQSYMYQQGLLTPSVTTTVDSDFYDGLIINYYGQTQEAGQSLSFYQRGNLMGQQVIDIIDMGIYGNEQWLKNAIAVSIMNTFIGLNEIPVNSQGESILTNAVLIVILQAIANGTISVGKTLTQLQIQKITEISGSQTAWRQVQDSGYWFDVTFNETSPNNFVANYTLIYSKNDVIRKVVGSDILI